MGACSQVLVVAKWVTSVWLVKRFFLVLRKSRMKAIIFFLISDFCPAAILNWLPNGQDRKDRDLEVLLRAPNSW